MPQPKTDDRAGLSVELIGPLRPSFVESRTIGVDVMNVMDGKREQRTGIRERHPDAWARATTAAHVALALWFAWNAFHAIEGVLWQWPAHLDTVGVDGRLYYRAAHMWLSGGDPWTAYTQTNTWPVSGQYIHELFTGPPPTVLAFVPFTWIPEDLFTVGWLGLTVAATVYALRRLGLPIWWLLFPPVVTGIVSGNPHMVALAVLLCGSNKLRWLAVPLKAYAVFPMLAERQWRALGILAAIVGASVVVFLPLWVQYRLDYAQVNEWLTGPGTAGGFSATRDPRLFALTAAALGALALIDRRAAGWLAVPALWPATQYFYATFALPLRSPWLAAALALAQPKEAAVVPWAIVAYSAARVAQWLYRRLWGVAVDSEAHAREVVE